MTRGNSPTEPERITIVATLAGQEVVLRIVGAFEIVARDAGASRPE